MLPLGILLIFICTNICLVSSAPYRQSVIYDTQQHIYHNRLNDQSRKPKIEYSNDNDNGNFNSGDESYFMNPSFQWHPYFIAPLPPPNVPSFQLPIYPQNNYHQSYQTMLPFPMFLNNFPTLPPLSQMDEQNFPALFPVENMHNFPTFPPLSSKNNHNFPTLPPRNEPNNFPTLPSLGPFPTLPPLSPLPTNKLTKIPPIPTQNSRTLPPVTLLGKPTLPPFTRLRKQNNSPKVSPLPLEHSQIFQKLPSANNPHEATENYDIFKTRFSDSNEDDGEEPLHSNLVTLETQEKTSQNNTSIETESPTILSNLFYSLFPKDLSTKEEEMQVDFSMFGENNSPAIRDIGVPLECSQGSCFCPRLHYYDSHSGRCLHQNSVWSV